MLEFIFSPDFQGVLLVLRILFIMVFLAMLGSVIFFLLKASWIKFYITDWSEFIAFRPQGVKKMEKDWLKVKARLETGLESEYKLACIEADGILETVLRRIGYKGETVGEQLASLTPANIPNLEDLKKAHQVRNNVVHDPDYRISLDEARAILGIYERAFKDLEIF